MSSPLLTQRLSALLLFVAVLSVTLTQSWAQCNRSPVQYGASGSRCARFVGPVQTLDDSTAFSTRFFSSFSCTWYKEGRPDVDQALQGLLAQVALSYKGEGNEDVKRGIILPGLESTTQTASLTLEDGDYVVSYTVSAGSFIEGLRLKTKAGKELSCGAFRSTNASFTANENSAFTALFARTPLPNYRTEQRDECRTEFINDLGFTETPVSCFRAFTTSTSTTSPSTSPSSSSPPETGAPATRVPSSPPVARPASTQQAQAEDGGSWIASALGIALVIVGTLLVAVAVIWLSVWYARRKRNLSEKPRHLSEELVADDSRFSLPLHKKTITRDRFSVSSSEGSTSFTSLHDEEAYAHFVSLQGGEPTARAEAKRYAPTYLTKQLSYIPEEDGTASSDRPPPPENGSADSQRRFNQP